MALSSYHFLLDQRLQRIDLAVVLALNKLDFSESTLTDDLESGEVVWLLLGSQESQVLDFGIAHAQLLLGLPVVTVRLVGAASKQLLVIAGIVLLVETC